MKQLEGMNLTISSISRKGMFECDFVQCCDNCGRVIVNYANVTNVDTGKSYVIGLDCKKTLIDKRVLSGLVSGLPDWEAKYKTKEFKAQQGHIEKFLLCSSRLDVDIEIDNNEIMITDRLPHKQFPELTGNIIYLENTQYLVRLGLGDYIKQLHNKIYYK